MVGHVSILQGGIEAGHCAAKPFPCKGSVPRFVFLIILHLNRTRLHYTIEHMGFNRLDAQCAERK